MHSRRQALISIVGLTAFGAAAAAQVRSWAAAPAGKTFEVTKTPEEWRKILNPMQYFVLRDHGTERAFSHPYDKNYAEGVYTCAGCDLPLYSSQHKFDSYSGWPSFWQPLENAVETSVDKSLFFTRTEVHCRRCGGHQGHVFEDGPKPTGLRYCMNGAAMKFVAKDKTAT